MLELELEKESFIQGKIEGWSPRAVYKLGDGTKWKLVRPKVQNFKRNNARVKLYTDEDEHYYMEIVGIVGKQAVSQIM